MVQVQFHGHSCFQFSSGEYSLIIDPFLTGNPAAVISADAIVATHVLVTHGHDDHVGDTIDLARRNNAVIICNFELAQIFEDADPKLRIMDLHVGGSRITPFGRVKLTIAHHGAGYGPRASQYAGPPVGMLITLGGLTIYHAGDTGLFLDMKLIGEMNRIDLACLPIGDNYTMGIDDAAHAVTLLKPRIVAPMHYNTWPPIAVDAGEFARLVAVRAPDTAIWLMKPGECRALEV